MIKCRCIKGWATKVCLLAKDIPALVTGKEEMNDMKKKLFAVITAAAMALSLVACGGVTITSVGLPSEVALEKGATQQLQLEYSAEGDVAAEKIAEAANKLTVEWSSSDESIVTVDAEGNVTAVAAGEAYVTATVKDKDGLTASTLVRVAVTPTGVEAPETLELVTNGENTKNLDAKIVPEDATGVKLAYESSDEAVATVDENGMVTAVTDGECVITAYVVSSEEETPVDTEVAESEPVDAASTDSGEAASGDATASEPVAEDSESAETAESEQVFEPLEQESSEPETTDTEVLDPEFATLMEDLKAETKVTVTTKVDAVTLSQNEGILNVGKSVTLTATVTPEEIAADTTVTWSSSDEAVATVDSNGKVTAVATGNATITATAGEESASCGITVEKATSKPAANSKPATSSTSGNTSTGAAAPSAPAAAPSNPAPAPAPAAPAPAPAAPAPAPEPSYNPPSDPSLGYDGNERVSSPIDNGCTPEEHAADVC